MASGDSAYSFWPKLLSPSPTQAVDARHCPSPDLVTFNALLSAFEKAAQWPRALELLTTSTLRRVALRPDVISFNAAISACEKAEDDRMGLWRKAGKWQLAGLLLTEVKTMRMQPDLIIYNAAITACEQAGQWQVAFSLLEQAEKSELKPNEITYQAVIVSSERLAWPATLTLLGAAAAADALTPLSVAAALRALREGARFTRASLGPKLLEQLQDRAEVMLIETLFEQAEPNRVRLDVILYNSTISAAGAGGGWRRAFSLLKQLDSKLLSPTVVTFGAAISACEKSSRWPSALQTFEEVESWRDTPVKRNVILCNATMSSAGKGLQWLEALQIFSRARCNQQLGLSTTSSNAVLSACEKHVQWPVAMALQAEMPQLRLQSDVITANVMISGLGKGGQWRFAVLVFAGCHRKQLEPTSVTCSAAVSASEEAKDWQRAIWLLECKTADRMSFNGAISACGLQSKWQEALLSFRLLEAFSLEASTVSYNSAISACEKAELWQEALHLFAQARTRRLHPDVVTYNAVISSCDKRLQWQLALSLLKELQMQRLAPTAITYSATISACEKSSQWQRALRLFESASRLLQPDAWIQGKNQGFQRRVEEDGVSRLIASMTPWRHALALALERPRGARGSAATYGFAVARALEGAAGACAVGLLRLGRFGSYTLQLLFEGNGTRLLRSNFTVPPEPSPLPPGPYCFDIDYDYAGATVQSNSTAASAIECQSLCFVSSSCLHFRFTYTADPSVERCELLSTGPLSGSASPNVGTVTGPKNCESRVSAAAGGPRPARTAVCWISGRIAWSTKELGGGVKETEAAGAVKDGQASIDRPKSSLIPVTIFVQGENFDPDYDRIVAVDATYVCGGAFLPGAPGAYDVKGLRPNTWQQWRELPCNDTGARGGGASAKCAEWRTALEELELLRVKDVQHSAPNLAISACGKAQQWDLALSVFESANTFKIEPSIITLNVAISACEKKNQWQGAWNLLGSGRAAALEVSVVTRNAMLSAFGKGAQWQRALFLLRAEDMPTPDILSFNAAIAACERGKKWQEALCLLREVEDLSCPDVITYNSAISACGKAAQWQRALEIFAALGRRSRLQPSLVSYNVAISACEKGHQWQGALHLLTLLRTIAEPTAHRVVAWSAAASACANCSQWRWALEVLEEIAGSSTNEVPFNAAIRACERASRWKEAMSTWSALEVYTLEPSVTTCNTVISALGGGGQWQRAMRFLFEHAHLSDRISFNTAISSCEKAAQWRRALRALGGHGRPVPASRVALNGAISACEKAARWEWALSLFQEMQDLKLTPTSITYHAVLRACLRAAQWQRAVLLHADARERRWRADAAMCDAAVNACLQGYKMSAGDKLMLRDNCSEAPSVAYTGASRPSPDPAQGQGATYLFETWVRFFGAPGIVEGLVLLQEDFESFTLRWNYPDDDGGGVVTEYHLFFRTCPGGNYTDGVESEYVIPVEPGENRWGVALNATYHFREPLAGFTPSSANQELLELTLFASEASQDERGLSADAFGAWTNLAALPKSSPALQLRQAVLLPQEDTPWYTGRPIYSPGFSNPLVGEVPSGYPYPEGFPAPGVRTCVNFSSYCATSPHQILGSHGRTWCTARGTGTDSEAPGLGPVCSVLAGPSFVTCTCESSLQNHPLQRCDRLRIRVNAGGDIRASITASVRLFATEDRHPSLKSEFGGLNSYRKVANAGFTVWQDFLMVQTTPELCAAECLSRLNNPAPCNSFKYHKVDQDCYLSSYVESAASPLRTDWPGDEQVAYALQTQQVLVFSGVFFSNITMLAETYLQPPPPSAPAFGAVELFFPSYVNQPWLRCRIDLSLVVPIHGQSTPTSLDFLVPSGFLGMALETRHVAVPTPLGRGYCGVTFRNPPDPRLVGESWILQVVSSGFVDGRGTERPSHARRRTSDEEQAENYSSAPVSVPHPLAVDGQLLGCAVHLNDPKYQPSLGRERRNRPEAHEAHEAHRRLSLKDDVARAFLASPGPCQGALRSCVCGADGSKASSSCTNRVCSETEPEPEGKCQPLTAFPKGDGLNTCTCPADGDLSKAQCTRLKCPKVDLALTTQSVDEGTCCPGYSFQHSDGCNTCHCGTSGLKNQSGCTLMACPPSMLPRERCMPMSTFRAADGFNMCTCPWSGLKAEASCTTYSCPREENGAENGTCCPQLLFTAPDGCNTCRCAGSGLKNESHCTRRSCPPPQLPSGWCIPHTVFPAGDGLNSCTCPRSGHKDEANCTKLACPAEVQPPSRKPPKEEGRCCPQMSFTASDGCNTCMCSDDGWKILGFASKFEL
eukprot:g27965.t1